MSVLMGGQDRFCVNGRSELGRSYRKKENICPVCKKWPPFSSNQWDYCQSRVQEGGSGNSSAYEREVRKSSLW